MVTKDYDGLTKQLKEKSYRNMLYGVYNLCDDECYIDRISNMGYDSDINSLEFMVFDTTDIKNDTVSAFKDEVEMDNPAIGIFVINGKRRSLIAVKPKKVAI